MSNPEPRPHPLTGNVNSHAGTWYKCANPICGVVDLREGALIETEGSLTCPNCGHEVLKEVV